MKKINLIKDINCKIDINRVASIINNVSDSIQINVIDDKFEFSNNPIKYPFTHHEYIAKLGSIKDVIIITDTPYIDNFFFYELNGLWILSFYNWQYLTTLPKENGLLYWICVFALYAVGEKADLKLHNDNTGCLSDFLGDKSGIDIGMKQASICSQCSKKIAKITLSTIEQKLINNVRHLLDILSKHSRWNESIFEENIIKRTVKKAPIKKAPINKGEICVLIASPSDSIEEREVLKSLDRQFRVLGFEDSTGYRIVTKGWEDLSPQNGYAQDIINNILLPEIDVIVGVLKHKMGTPTKNINGSIRAESGTAEELYYAIEKHPEKVICMLYVNTTPLPISAQDPDLTNKVENLISLNTFIENIKNKVMYQQFGSKDELLQLVMPQLAQNITRYFIASRKRKSK